jgi:hypothetical protein
VLRSGSSSGVAGISTFMSRTLPPRVAGNLEMRPDRVDEVGSKQALRAERIGCIIRQVFPKANTARQTVAQRDGGAFNGNDQDI